MQTILHLQKVATNAFLCVTVLEQITTILQNGKWRKKGDRMHLKDGPQRYCIKGSTKQARKITKEIDVINVTVKQLPE